MQRWITWVVYLLALGLTLSRSQKELPQGYRSNAPYQTEEEAIREGRENRTRRCSL